MIPPDSVQPSRIQPLNDGPEKDGKFVLYWMQQSQRAEENHALEYAVEQANRLDLGVVVGFGLMADYPEANLRHFAFMVEGLKETQETLRQRGIKMIVRMGSPPHVAVELSRHAAMIVCDRGYLRHQKAWRDEVAKSAACLVVQVESDVVIPVDVVSNKAEYAARTIRPKIHRHLHDYLVPVAQCKAKRSSLDIDLAGEDLNGLDRLLARLCLDCSVTPVSSMFAGGTSVAKSRFAEFLATRFTRYVQNRNQPQTDDISHMSPYLHFGQISPIFLALRVQSLGGELEEAQASFVEELLVRRELAMNFVNFTDDYDSFSCLPAWASKTLHEHRDDVRHDQYNREQLELAQTHDRYWNAAMQEMKVSGFMHNYMRMYWGKKILEWSSTPESAFQTALAINNKYFVDGRDANSYTGVAWVFGVHDRAWFERPIFGKIRYMAASGLERKCKIEEYIDKVDAMTPMA